ncbi:hypothetical protein ACE6H2_006345 [Prunus campanulata]
MRKAIYMKYASSSFQQTDEIQDMHFRHGHFLCEDESCLAKRFVVFQSEAEMKWHNTIEHGGRLSRSKRNAALQIPPSFRYQRTSEQDHRRGRGRTFRCESSENQLSMAIQASLEIAHAENTFHDPSSSSGQVAPHLGDISDIDPIVDPFESLTTTDIETSSRYRQALGHSSSNAPLEESSFPPLSVALSSSESNPRSDSDVVCLVTPWQHIFAAKATARRLLIVLNNGPRPSSYASSAQAQVETRQSTVLRGSGLNNGPRPSSSYASSAQAQVETRQTTVHGLSSSGSLRDSSKTKSGRISHSTSAPNLVENGSVQPSVSDFPPVSAAQVPTKSLVEKIRAALEFDEDKYTIFKDISGQYRQGLVNTEIYLDFVPQFGLLHLVLDLARLRPDGQKQKELIDAYNASIRKNIAQGNGWSQGSVPLKEGNSSKKGKGKISEAENSISKNTLADIFLAGSVQELQSNCRPSEEAVEVLPKDAYRAAKEKSNLLVNDHQEELNSRSQPLVQLRGEKDSQTTGSGSNPNLGDGGGGSKQRKKSSKFHRVRLGDGSAAALLDLRNSDP